MLTPEYLDGIAEPLVEIYSGLESNITADIARRISKAGRLTDAAAWQVFKLEELGASQQYVAEQIAAALGKTKTEVESLFKAAGLRSLTTDAELQTAAIAAGRLPSTTLPLTAGPAMQQILQADAQRTMNTLRGLTGTMARDASGQLNKWLDQAQLMIQSGAFTPEQAVEQAVTKLAAEGLTHFDYASNTKIAVDAAVRRALVTGVNQATAKISEANAEALGTDLVEVSSHADSRPEHAEWQGGVYALHAGTAGYRTLAEATGYGTGEGLCGWNCRHSFFPFIEGVSEELPREEYDPTTYAAEQKQRHNERMIREWKRRAQTMEAGGVDATKAKAKVAEWQARQREHVEKFDLARMYDREKVYNAPRGTKRPSAAAERRRLAAEAEERAATATATKAEEAARAAAEAKAAAEAEAAAKREAYLARKREDTAKWRARKKAEADAAKAAAEEAARKAAEEAAEKAKREAYLAKKRATKPTGC